MKSGERLPNRQTQRFLADLKATVCRCGASKSYGKSFCHQCYYALPAPMRKALYRRVGLGYAAAYEDALGHLGFAEDELF